MSDPTNDFVEGLPRLHQVQATFEVEAISDEDAASQLRYLVHQMFESREQNANPRVTAWWLAEGSAAEVWEPFADSPIPKMMADIFPREPLLEDFRSPSGHVHSVAFSEAHERWQDECLTLAASASELPDVLARLERAEHTRDGVLDVLDRTRLPHEPAPRDPALHPDHDLDPALPETAYEQWREAFTQAARRREKLLRDVIAEAGPRTSYLPEQFSRDWIPRDLVAVATLRALLDLDPTITGRLLDRSARQDLEGLLIAADADVEIPNPDEPDGPLIYAGPASGAHEWIPPGVYPATGLDTEGEFRVVVGRCQVGDTVMASAAFPSAEHDSAVMDKISRTLTCSAEPAPAAQVLAQITELVASTGRIYHEPGTLVGQDASLPELLTEREHQLGPDPSNPDETTMVRGSRADPARSLRPGL